VRFEPLSTGEPSGHEREACHHEVMHPHTIEAPALYPHVRAGASRVRIEGWPPHRSSSRQFDFDFRRARAAVWSGQGAQTASSRTDRRPITSAAQTTEDNAPRANGTRGDVTWITQPISRAPIGVLPNHAIW
jgi:hypothetical protein